MWGFKNKNKSNYNYDNYGGYSDEGYNDDYSGGGGYYRYYTPKPKYDMSISLETRVSQLIKTVTGKELKLAQAEGWGNDDKYFYYNPEDLKDVSDDEVLGRILQQLGKEMYLDKIEIKKFKESKKEQPYRHLIDSLEANRADRQLAERYAGTGYYAHELWERRKVTDNPIQKYDEAVVSFKDWFNEEHNVKGPDRETLYKKYQNNEDYGVQQEYDKKVGGSLVQNDAWEFCFNIHALQNGETNFDFTKDDIAGNFTKALPYIDKYLTAPTLEDALKVYPEIKKLYPLPNEQQQDQMDSQLGQTQGLSAQQMADAAEKAIGEAEDNMDGEEGRDMERFKFDFSNDMRRGEYDEKNALEIYQRYLTEHQGTANVLHALIRSILKDNAVKRFDRPFKRGKLDTRRIYKMLAIEDFRIFKKPRNVSHKEYLMSIIIDMSGSMRGTKSKFACQGAVVLSNVLDKLGFPYEVLAYNGSVYTVKPFNKKLNKGLLASLENAEGDNNEIDTVKLLTKHITNFDPANKYRKSIFWVTDGESNGPAQVKRDVSKLEAEHNATVFAVGIGNSINEDHLRQSYPHFLKVETLSELPKELIGLMRSQFRRG